MNKLIVFLSFLFLSFSSLAQESENTVKLLFLGDIMGHGPQIRAAYNAHDKTYDYNPNYQHLNSLFTNADITLGNLEVTLGIPPFRGYPQFSSPAALARDTQLAGIDVLVTANNHTCDKRKKGLEKTIFILDSLGISHTGTFINQKAKDSLSPLIIEQKGIKIALLSYTYGTNGIAVTPPNIVNLLDKKTIIKDVAQAKTHNPDQIIAFVHWGGEYQNLSNAYQKKWFSFLKEQGVNIVIGSHPHVVQPMKWNKKENSLVVYSLGNFVSNQRKFPRDGGALFELTLTKKENKISITNAQYVLTWVYKKKQPKTYEVGHSGTSYYVLPVNYFEYTPAFFEKKSDYNQMMRYTRHARLLLEKNNQNITERKPFSDLLYWMLWQ